MTSEVSEGSLEKYSVFLETIFVRVSTFLKFVLMAVIHSSFLNFPMSRDLGDAQRF